MTIKNVIFDLGNVLIDFKPLKYIKSLGYDDETALQILNKTVKDPLWADMDKGIYLSKESYIKAFKTKYPNMQDEIEKFLGGPWMEKVILPLKENQKMIDLVKDKGLKYYILSNYPKDAFEYTYKMCPFIQNADGMVISYDVLMIKPDINIYLRLLNKYHLIASECLFIDDLFVNVQGAKKAGMNAFVFNNLDDAYKKLEYYLGGKNETIS